MLGHVLQPGNAGKPVPSQRMKTGYGEPPKLDAKQVHEKKCQPEGRDGKTEENKKGDTLVDDRIAPGGSQNANRYCQSEFQYKSNDVNRESYRKPLLDLVNHRPIIRSKGTAKIKSRQPLEPSQILHVKRLVQAVELAEPLPGLGRGLGIHG